MNWFDFSGLDYCNSLFAGVTNRVISRMQLIQDAAAQSLLGTQLFQHNVPFLKSLCWLLVKFCVKIKVLLLVQVMLDVTLVPFTGSMFLTAQQDHNYYCKGMQKERVSAP